MIRKSCLLTGLSGNDSGHSPPDDHQGGGGGGGLATLGQEQHSHPSGSQPKDTVLKDDNPVLIDNHHATSTPKYKHVQVHICTHL